MEVASAAPITAAAATESLGTRGVRGGEGLGRRWQQAPGPGDTPAGSRPPPPGLQGLLWPRAPGGAPAVAPRPPPRVGERDEG